MQIKLNLLKNPQEINILGLGRDELLAIVTDFESQPKRASMRVSQLWSWIYCHGISSFDKMTNIDKNLRSQLQKVLTVSRPIIEKKEISNDGTIKYLFCLKDRSKIETVYIPEEKRSTNGYKFTIKKTSDDSDSSKIHDNVAIKGWFEVEFKKQAYPRTAHIGYAIRAHSEHTGGVPNFTSLVKGLLVKVPSNYNQPILESGEIDWRDLEVSLNRIKSEC